jgi:hypothetical protein
MKRLILMMTVLLGFAFNAHAANPMAETTTGNGGYEKVLVKLFNKEAKKLNSPIHAYIAALKTDPENDGFEIYDTIDTADIVRLDSGVSGGTFEINYLIIIRAGYKTNTSQVGYLKAQTLGPIDESKPTIVKITEPGKVTIE